MDFAGIERARALLHDSIPVTRLVPADSLAQASAADVYLKLENEAPTSSFKCRGALHTLCQQARRGPVAGVVTSSTGNHGAAIAWAARRMGVPALIFLPQHPNPVKRARIAQQGARFVEAGRDLEESREHAARYAAEQGWFLVVDGQDEDLTAGAATIGCEILEQVPATDVIYVPVGDSSLIRGLAFAAKHLRPQARVIGVQAERAPAYYRSWTERRVVATDTSDTLADGLAARVPLESNVRQMWELVDDMRLVTDEEMLRAIYRLILDEHTVAEPAGAATAAAFLKSGWSHKGETVVVLVTGANIAPEVLRRAVAASHASYSEPAARSRGSQL